MDEVLNTMKQDNTVLYSILFIVIVLAVVWILERANHLVFKKVQQNHEGLHLRFFERVIGAIILIVGLIVAVSVFDGVDSIWKTLLGGTAIVSAVLAFAAQDVIKDILAGLMISLNRPFEVGNRIELEDGTFGVVEDITMRHVVLRGVDSLRIIVPNSKLNAMSLKNYSYHSDIRSILFRFHIAYGSDVEKAKSIIRQINRESALTVPGVDKGKYKEYAPVYFMAYEDSSLQLATTVYYKASTPTEKVMNDINMAVDKAFAENGIEIPFAYVNVIQKGV